MACEQSGSRASGLQNMGSHAETVYKQNIRNVDELRERIVESWDYLDQCVIDSAISQ